MTEVIFEFLSCAVDFVYLLFLYAKVIGEEWKTMRAFLAIGMITCIQYAKDTIIHFNDVSIIIDCIIMVSFLFLYIKQKDFKNFVFAMVFNTVFGISVLMFASITMFIGVDVGATLNFGIERVLFTIFVKIFIIICFLILYRPLCFLYSSLTNVIEYLFVFIIASLEVLLSHVLGLVEDNQKILHFSLLLLNLVVFIFFLIYRYSVLLRRKAEYDVIQHTMIITADHVEKMEEEYEEVRKIRHDIKNQLLTLQFLLEQDNKEEAIQNIQAIKERIDIHTAMITNNVYIDALLRQKMAEFSDIDFQLIVSVTEDFTMNGTDIISLLSNIIDNACEELYRIQKASFQLTIIGDAHKLLIKEENECRNQNNLVTDKDKKHHGYGLKIIDEIISRYNGFKEVSVEENHYFISIFIPF